MKNLVAIVLVIIGCSTLLRADSSIGNILTGGGPRAIALNPVTNKIYVANQTANTVSVIDGTNNL